MEVKYLKQQSDPESLSLSEFTNKFILQIQENQNNIFEHALRNVAVPPIKGEITPNKIKWRGIRLVNKNQFGKSESWIEQRGKRISEIITFKGAESWN